LDFSDTVNYTISVTKNKDKFNTTDRFNITFDALENITTIHYIDENLTRNVNMVIFIKFPEMVVKKLTGKGWNEFFRNNWYYFLIAGGLMYFMRSVLGGKGKKNLNLSDSNQKIKDFKAHSNARRSEQMNAENKNEQVEDRSTALPSNKKYSEGNDEFDQSSPNIDMMDEEDEKSKKYLMKKTKRSNSNSDSVSIDNSGSTPNSGSTESGGAASDDS